MAVVIPVLPAGVPSDIRLSVQGLAAVVDMAGWPLAAQPTAVAIAMAESSGNICNINKSSGACGLFQILPSAHADLVGSATDSRWISPSYNAKGALSIYSAAESSWKPWESFTTGAYLAYAAQAQLAVTAWHTSTQMDSAQGKQAAYQSAVGSTILAYDQVVSELGGPNGTLDMSNMSGFLGAGAIDTAKAAQETPGISELQAVGSLAQLAVGAGKWITNTQNIMRIVYVAMGAVLVVGGLMIVAKPAVAPLAKLVP